MMPNADAIALGKQIKAVRKAMKMTQEQLALKSNVSVKYIANIENGKQNRAKPVFGFACFDFAFDIALTLLKIESGEVGNP